MTVKQNTRIILSEKRKQEHLDNISSSRYSIAIQQEEEHPTRHFGSLHLFSETTLGAQKQKKYALNEATQLLIIPLIGQIRAENASTQKTVDVGEALILSTLPTESLTLFNDFENSEVHYVIAGFVSNESVQQSTQFTLESDSFSTLFDEVSHQGLVKATISQWKGRSDGQFETTTSQTFAWVVQGSFEIQNCLLQKGDGLAISDSNIIEFEALANDSIILFLEIA